MTCILDGWKDGWTVSYHFTGQETLVEGLRRMWNEFRQLQCAEAFASVCSPVLYGPEDLKRCCDFVWSSSARDNALFLFIHGWGGQSEVGVRQLFQLGDHWLIGFRVESKLLENCYLHTKLSFGGTVGKSTVAFQSLTCVWLVRPQLPSRSWLDHIASFHSVMSWRTICSKDLIFQVNKLNWITSWHDPFISVSLLGETCNKRLFHVLSLLNTANRPRHTSGSKSQTIQQCFSPMSRMARRVIRWGMFLMNCFSHH